MKACFLKRGIKKWCNFEKKKVYSSIEHEYLLLYTQWISWDKILILVRVTGKIYSICFQDYSWNLNWKTYNVYFSFRYLLHFIFHCERQDVSQIIGVFKGETIFSNLSRWIRKWSFIVGFIFEKEIFPIMAPPRLV